MRRNRAVLTLLVLLSGSGMGWAHAQTDPDSVRPAPAEEQPADTTTAISAAPERYAPPPEVSRVPIAPPSAPIFLGGRQVFRVRAGRDGLDPVQRAAVVRGRIDRALGDSRMTSDSLHVAAGPQGVEVWMGPHFLWVITPGDLEVGDSVHVESLTRDLREAAERERARRRPIRILISIGFALGLTLVAWVAFRLILHAGRRWRAWISRTVARRLPAIRVRDFEVLSHKQVAGIVTAVLGGLHWVAAALLLYAYVTSTLSLFPWTQSWSWRLLHFGWQRFAGAVAALASALPGLATVVVIFVVFRWLTGLADAFFGRIERGESLIKSLHPELARPTKRLVQIFLWIVAVMLAYPNIPGSQSKSVQGISILLGLMVSLGSTGIVGNMIAGLVLTYSRAFSVGDRVRIGTHVGDVVSHGFFSTKIKTLRNEEVTIPNGLVTAWAVLNYTRLAAEEGLILYTEVTIGYDVPWRKVHSLLIESALRVDGIEPEPAPWVNQRSLNDSHVTYELNCVTRDSHAQLRLYSYLHETIQDAFSRAGIEILSPGYHAIRDANAPILPDDPAGPRNEPGGFRIRRGPPGVP